MLLGMDCYVVDEGAGGLKEDPGANCNRGSALIGFSVTDPERLYFRTGFDGMELLRILSVFALPEERAWFELHAPRAVLDSVFKKKTDGDGDAVGNPVLSFVKQSGGVTTVGTGMSLPGA